MNFNWNQSLATGNEAIDRQHQELFRRLEILVESAQGSNYLKSVSDSISFLENYIFRHFTAEEKIQIANHYPDYESHRQQHREFLGAVGKLRQEYDADSADPVMLLKTIAFLGNWITEHVNKSDKALAVYLQGGQNSLLSRMQAAKTA
jgi:hemerythrin-like metal-binding protein